MQSMNNVWRKRARATACVYLFSLFYSDGWLIKKNISIKSTHSSTNWEQNNGQNRFHFKIYSMLTERVAQKTAIPK